MLSRRTKLTSGEYRPSKSKTPANGDKVPMPITPFRQLIAYIEEEIRKEEIRNGH